MDKRTLNRQTRDHNIAVSQKRKKPEESGETKKLGLSKEEIAAKLKPVSKKPPPKKEKPKPYYILKPQEQFLAERDYEIIEDLNQSYIEQSKFERGTITDKGDKRQKNLYFTSIKDCPRAIYYKFFEPERARDYTVKGLILFDDGKQHHTNIQRRLEDRGKARNPEGYLEIPEVEASGYYDQLYPIGNDNGWFLCDITEVKSKLPFACESINQDDYDQGQLYCYAAQFSKRLKTKRIKVVGVRLLYKDRAVQTEEVHFAWRVKPDLDRQREILDYLRFLKFTVIDKKTLVPHPYEKKSTKCIYCRFKEWCWREYPDVVEARETVDLEEIKLPTQEILESHAKRLAEILRQEKDLREERKALEPILLYYFTKTETALFPLNDTEALAQKQGKSTEWDRIALREALGLELYGQIAEPKATLITDLIKREYLDTAVFEKFKKYKLNKPSVYIKKIKGETNAD